MDNFDMILYICFFAAAVIGALLVFHLFELVFVWWRIRRASKKQYPHGKPWWWRT